jgi:hypothetical protein
MGMKMTNNRIWFELEVSSDAAVNEERAEKATRILRKLGDDISKFWWNTRINRYCFTFTEAGNFTVLGDSGHWLNLDYMAK